ncbi:MAG: hypothetical protein KatS3mg067_1637 [Thermosynechococcus sp.]|uniref:hypothetical protein n=1 Tax=Thermosynechococcus sp. TaxID=2814275 RepID=UPI0021FA67A0|nr:hypothetical protein [Thermosynechococcus sp.]BCX12699.1 MAG: hypothetical protein KatS3mg067_1637 [Thermosynechococcus sp.]
MEPLDPVDREAFTNPTVQRLWFFVYLLPIFGMIPALWQLSRRGSDRQTRQVSRLALVIGLSWLLGYGLLNGLASVSEVQSLHHGLLLLLNSLWGSAYFLVNLGLMVRLWRRQSLKLPFVQPLMKYLP